MRIIEGLNNFRNQSFNKSQYQRMKKLLFIFSLLIPCLADSQIELSEHMFDFHEIVRGTDRVVDISIENNGSEKTMLLRSDFTHEYDFLFSSRIIEADSTATLRIKYNPRTMGEFKEEFSLWFTTMNTPVKIQFKGDVQYIDNSENPACPNFSTRPADCCPSDELFIEVVDEKTQKPIRDARVRVVEKGVLQTTFETDRNGEIISALPISYYYLIVDAEDYIQQDTACYINRRNSSFRFEMAQAEKPVLLAETFEEDEVEEEVMETVEEPKVEVIPEETVEVSPIEEPIEPEVVETIEEPDLVEDANLPESKYEKNNLVFLIDVSHSMNQKGRMDLLKASMLELVDVLRPIDRVSVITYAARPKVVLPSRSGDQKDEIKSVVRDLEAGGMTSGAKGFKMAYEMARKQFVEKGNNQIIVVTDGAFRVEDQENIEVLVKKWKRKNIITSVLGVKSNVHASKKLGIISELGAGSYIQINDFDESHEVLIKEIKKQSGR